MTNAPKTRTRHKGESVPAEPFIKWLHRQHDLVKAEDVTSPSGLSKTALHLLAHRLGVSSRLLFRYMRSLDGVGAPTTTFSRERVQVLLEAGDARFEDVYPDFEAEVVLEPDAFCPTCQDQVTPIDGVCPWCDTGVRQPIPLRVIDRRITDHQLRGLYLLHTQGGISVMELAHQSFQRFGYAYPRGCAEGIRRGWKRLHLDVEDERRAA